MASDVQKEGTLAYDVKVPDGYWETTGQPCRFPTTGSPGIYTETTILGDHTIDVQIDGPLGRFWEIKSKSITDKPKKIMLAITWKDDEVKLYVNGDLHQAQHIGPLS